MAAERLGRKWLYIESNAANFKFGSERLALEVESRNQSLSKALAPVNAPQNPPTDDGNRNDDEDTKTEGGHERSQ